MAGQALGVMMAERIRVVPDRHAKHVIKPKLDEVSVTDWREIEAIRALGYETAAKIGREFVYRALSPADWKLHIEARQARKGPSPVEPQFVEVEGVDVRAVDEIERAVEPALGAELDPNELELRLPRWQAVDATRASGTTCCRTATASGSKSALATSSTTPLLESRDRRRGSRRRMGGVAPIIVVADPETGAMTSTSLLVVVWLAPLAGPASACTDPAGAENGPSGIVVADPRNDAPRSSGLAQGYNTKDSKASFPALPLLRSSASCGASQIPRWLGCVGRAEQALDQALEAGHSLLQSVHAVSQRPQLGCEGVHPSLERTQPLVVPDLQREHETSQGGSHAQDADQLSAHSLSVTVVTVPQELENSIPRELESYRNRGKPTPSSIRRALDRAERLARGRRRAGHGSEVRPYRGVRVLAAGFGRFLDGGAR